MKRPRFFDVKPHAIEELRYQPPTDKYYSKEVLSVVKAFDVQIGQTDEETTGYFKIEVCQDAKTGFLEPMWPRRSSLLDGIPLITNKNYRREEDNITIFDRQRSVNASCVEGFLSTINIDKVNNNRLYVVLYTNCTDVDASSVCIEIDDIAKVSRYSDNSMTVLALYQNAAVDGNTSFYPQAENEGWDTLDYRQMKYIIDNFWPEPELIWSRPDIIKE